MSTVVLDSGAVTDQIHARPALTPAPAACVPSGAC